MSAFNQLKRMLERAWIGHAVRSDSDCDSILIETELEDEFTVCEFQFSENGNLKGIECYRGQQG